MDYIKNHDDMECCELHRKLCKGQSDDVDQCDEAGGGQLGGMVGGSELGRHTA